MRTQILFINWQFWKTLYRTHIGMKYYYPFPGIHTSTLIHIHVIHIFLNTKYKNIPPYFIVKATLALKGDKIFLENVMKCCDNLNLPKAYLNTFFVPHRGS